MGRSSRRAAAVAKFSQAGLLFSPTIATEPGGSVILHFPADHGHKPNPKYPPEIQADIAKEKCMICEIRFGKHSYEEFEHCMDEIVERARTNLAL
jgi:hypothetical protein